MFQAFESARKEKSGEETPFLLNGMLSRFFPLLAFAVAVTIQSPRNDTALIAHDKQPLRCLANPCEQFKGPCGGDSECTTNKCYEGKCAKGPGCNANGNYCNVLAPHTCCTGRCNKVEMVESCIHVLSTVPGFKDWLDADGHPGRICRTAGVCGSWEKSKDMGPVMRPWGVFTIDDPGMYFGISGITFEDQAVVDVSKAMSRRPGRMYEGVDPAIIDPKLINDAGSIIFAETSGVDRAKLGKVHDGEKMIDYCVAPILRAGVGGGFYAVGKNCCENDTWECGADVWRTGMVVSSDTSLWSGGYNALEAHFGDKIHSEEHGVVTSTPMFLHMVADRDTELKAPNPMFSYVPETKEVFCAAPVLRKAADGSFGAQESINYWAVGTNCCEPKPLPEAYPATAPIATFECGAVDDPAAKSGENLDDLTGNYRMAIAAAELSYGVKALLRPMYVSWTAKTLVQNPKR